MKRPKIATVKISWIDEYGEEHNVQYSENELEEAEIQIGLWTGNITLSDLEP